MKPSVSILISTMLTPALLLAGCHRQPATPAAAAPTAAVIATSGIVVSDARLVLPAVKGHPGAAYFTLANGTGATATLIGVDVVGARQAQMHETSGGTMAPLAQLDINPGRRASFAPSGKHVMVFDLAPTLVPGGSGEIIMHFQGGKTVSAPLRIEAVGGDMPAMGGMTMGGKP